MHLNKHSTNSLKWGYNSTGTPLVQNVLKELATVYLENDNLRSVGFTSKWFIIWAFIDTISIDVNLPKISAFMFLLFSSFD